jgi:hypothetical protein
LKDLLMQAASRMKLQLYINLKSEDRGVWRRANRRASGWRLMLLAGATGSRQLAAACTGQLAAGSLTSVCKEPPCKRLACTAVFQA